MQLLAFLIGVSFRPRDWLSDLFSKQVRRYCRAILKSQTHWGRPFSATWSDRLLLGVIGFLGGGFNSSP